MNKPPQIRSWVRYNASLQFYDTYACTLDTPANEKRMRSLGFIQEKEAIERLVENGGGSASLHLASDYVARNAGRPV